MVSDSALSYLKLQRSGLVVTGFQLIRYDGQRTGFAMIV